MVCLFQFKDKSRKGEKKFVSMVWFQKNENIQPPAPLWEYSSADTKFVVVENGI
jgi:hypothetical protein